jgi:transcriptional regulator with XRE-family HTH domain
MDTETMGERIRMLRLARGLSQQQLADRLGVTTGAVSQWESSSTENIKLRTFLELCEVLVVTPHYLVLGQSAATPQPPKRLVPPNRR